MIRRFIGLIAVSMIPVVALAESDPKSPTSPPPWVCLAKASDKDGKVQVQLSVTKMVPYWVSVMHETRGGGYVPKRHTYYKACVVSAVVLVDGKKVVASRKDGKAVDPKELLTLLSKEVKVLVFTEGKVDPYYLDVVGDQVLLVTIPADVKFPFRPSIED